MKLILIVFTVIELLFILCNDVPFITNSSSNAIWNDKGFFILHLLILFVCITGFWLIKILYKYENIYKLVICILTILLLSLVAIINIIEQTVHTNVSSIFIANLIIFSGVILLSFPLNLAMYLVPFLIYLRGLIAFQHNVDLLISNSINGLIFFLAAILISTVIYSYHYEAIAENLILEETNLKLDYMSTHDPLTALLNRKSFRTQVAEKMNIINKKQSFLILIDIDHFKYINDKFGHPIGDIVLKEISNILMKYIKANDLAARWGDEEFLVFLFETSTDEAYNITNKIRLIE